MIRNKHWMKRRQFLVDRQMQLSVVLSMGAVLVCLTMAYVGSVFLFDTGGVGPNSAEIRRLAFVIPGLYFGLVLLATMLVGVVVTQRIAGPARVIEDAVRGLRENDYARRLSLRERDHLKSLAAELAAFRGELQ